MRSAGTRRCVGGRGAGASSNIPADIQPPATPLASARVWPVTSAMAGAAVVHSNATVSHSVVTDELALHSAVLSWPSVHTNSKHQNLGVSGNP